MLQAGMRMGWREKSGDGAGTRTMLLGMGTINRLNFERCNLGFFVVTPPRDRNNDDIDNDDDQHGDEVVSASHFVHQSDRHLPRRLFCVRVHRAARVRRRQLHVLGNAQ